MTLPEDIFNTFDQIITLPLYQVNNLIEDVRKSLPEIAKLNIQSTFSSGESLVAEVTALKIAPLGSAPSTRCQLLIHLSNGEFKYGQPSATNTVQISDWTLVWSLDFSFKKMNNPSIPTDIRADINRPCAYTISQLLSILLLADLGHFNMDLCELKDVQPQTKIALSTLLLEYISNLKKEPSSSTSRRLLKVNKSLVGVESTKVASTVVKKDPQQQQLFETPLDHFPTNFQLLMLPAFPGTQMTNDTPLDVLYFFELIDHEKSKKRTHQVLDDEFLKIIQPFFTRDPEDDDGGSPLPPPPLVDAPGTQSALTIPSKTFFIPHIEPLQPILVKNVMKMLNDGLEWSLYIGASDMSDHGHWRLGGNGPSDLVGQWVINSVTNHTYTLEKQTPEMDVGITIELSQFDSTPFVKCVVKGIVSTRTYKDAEVWGFLGAGVGIKHRLEIEFTVLMGMKSVDKKDGRLIMDVIYDPTKGPRYTAKLTNLEKGALAPEWEEKELNKLLSEKVLERLQTNQGMGLFLEELKKELNNKDKLGFVFPGYRDLEMESPRFKKGGYLSIMVTPRP